MFFSPAVASLLRDLHLATGARFCIYDTELREVIGVPEQNAPFCRCLQTDPGAKLLCQLADREAFEQTLRHKRPHLYKCCFGLWEAVFPLEQEGVLIGYLMFGQITDGNISAKSERLSSLPTPIADKARLHLSSLPAYTAERAQALCRLLPGWAEQICRLSSAPLRGGDLAESVLRYIHRHLNGRLTAEHLCGVFHTSRSTLLETVSRQCGMPLGAYVTQRRIQKAQTLLRDGRLPISRVAQECGYADQGYFSKVFARAVGCSPSLYRQTVGGLPLEEA